VQEKLCVGGLPDIGRRAGISAFAAPAPCMFFLLTGGMFAFILLNKRWCAKSSVRGRIRHGNYRRVARYHCRGGYFFSIIFSAVFAGALMTAVSALSGQVKRF